MNRYATPSSLLGIPQRMRRAADKELLATVSVSNVDSVLARTYVPTDTKPMNDTTTGTERWYNQRLVECNAIKRFVDGLAPSVIRTLVVFEKANHMCKRMVAIATVIPQGIVWFDYDGSAFKPRKLLNVRTLNEETIRSMYHTTLHVYAQSAREVLKEHAHRMDARRREYGLNDQTPRDRRPQKFMQECKRPLYRGYDPAIDDPITR